MIRISAFAVFFLFTMSLHAQRPDYPNARRDNLVETLHGTKVADPYRWLEDVDSEETGKWIAQQNAISGKYFSETPGQEWIEKKMTELWEYDKYSIPRQAGGRLFYTKKTGLQNQGILFWKEDKADAEAQELLNPNALSDDGTVALSGYSISEDGKWIAYALSEGGSDWSVWRVREVKTGKDLDEEIKWVKFSGASWDRKGEGFYYSRYPEPGEGDELESVNENQKVYYHKVNTPQSKDRIVYERPDEPKWGFSNWVTEDAKYLTHSIWKASGSENAFFYRDLSAADSKVVELIPHFDNEYSILGNDGPLFYFKTDLDAPKGRLISIDVSQENPEPVEILAEAENSIDDVSLLGDRFYISYLVDVQTQVKVFDLKGKFLNDVEFPGVGSIYGFGGKRDLTDTFYYFTSYTEPGTIYRYNLESGSEEIFAKPEVAFDSGKYITRQVFYPTKDGTRIPMFITHRKDLVKDGNNPVRLYGYGGFNISLTPSYSTSIATWLEMGGVHAVANLRGGGEYGEEWHEAGTKDRKQNVFNDFIAAAEYLIDEKYTQTSRLAIAGGSNGGLLVGACFNQRPDLFGAGIAAVGVFDMLRFHKFTIGWAWTSDFGDPDKAEEFPALLAYSPYHTVQTDAPYPPLLITTADHDDRVFPAHSFKFGAALQNAQSGDSPILLRIETKAGHGAGKPTSKAIEETVDEWSFLARELKMEIPPKTKGKEE